MQQEDPNYGRHSEQPGLTRVPVGGMSAQEERTWSMLAHLSTLLNLITGIGGPIAALVIWLVYKDKSQRVAFHALQSLWYQVAWIVIFAIYGIVTFVLSVITLGLAAFVLVPLAFVLFFVPLVHQCYAAYKVNQGVDYRYPFIADMIDGSRRFA